MSFEINDLLPYYPDQNDPHFQSKIYKQYESRKFKYDPNEKPPQKRGEYYSNQEEFAFLMLILNFIILASGYGTGKTCAVFRGTEKIRKLYKKGESPFRRCFYVTKGPILEEQAKEQLMCKCTKEGEYDTYKVRSADKPKKRTARINKSLGEYYDFPHYRTLANEINAYYDTNKEYLINKYNNGIFVLDEIQILNNPKRVDKKEQEEESEEDNDEMREEDEEEVKEKKDNYNDLYYALIKLFDILPNKKVIAVSATLATNDINNYIAPINLVNPPDNRIDLDEDITNWSFEDILPYIRNKVVYVKEELPDVDIIVKGSPIKYESEKSSINGVRLNMSTKQSKVYEKQSSGFFDRKLIEASNLVYPNKEVGKTGFDKYFKIENGVIKFKNVGDEKYFKGDNLKELSVKDDYTVNICLNNPKKKIAIYDELVVGSGLLNVGKDLELVGYKRFMANTSIYENEAYVGEVCPTRKRQEGLTLKERYLKRVPRYAIITQFSANDNKLLKVFNSPENVTGKIIQVIIISKKARDGINLLATTIFIRRSGPRHMTSYMQGLYRILRSGGFQDLIRYYEKKGTYAGKIQLEVHNLVAVSKHKKSIDAKLYVEAEKKEIDIRKINRYFKRASLNCYAQLERNTKGVDYTLGCDYKKCKYKCFDKIDDIDDIRYNEYNILFSEDDVKKCIDFIITFFKTYNSIRIERLFEILNSENFSNHIITMAIFDIIFNKVSIRNLFGYSNFLYERNGILYISGEFPYNNSRSDTLDSYYSQNIIAFDNQTFGEFIEGYIIPKIDKKIDALLKIGNGEKIKKKIYDMELEERAHLAEYTVMNPDIPFYDEIISTSKYFLFTFKEPISKIEKAIEKYPKVSKNNPEKPVGGRGRKKKSEKRKVKKEKEEVYGEEVKVHSYYLVDKGSRSLVSNFINTTTTRIRIFQDGKWRNATPHEKMVYEKLILKETTRKLEKFNQYKFYGSIMPDKKFRVIDTRGLAKENKREKKVGRECNTLEHGKNGYLKIMYSIEMPIKQYPNIDINKKRKEIKKYFSNKAMYKFETNDDIDSWKAKKVNYYYYWIKDYSKNNVKELCETLKRYFYKNKMMLIV